MTKAISESTPGIDFDDISHEGVKRRVRLLDSYIRKNPVAILNVIGKLGGDLNSIDYAERRDRETTLRRDYPYVVAEYFEQRYDDSVSFDLATEEALKTDKVMENLLEKRRGATSDRVQTGKMTSHMRPNAEAPGIRDELRKYRLSFYIGQILAQQEQAPQTVVAQPGQVQSTG